MPHSVYLSCEAPGLLLANGRCLGSLQPKARIPPGACACSGRPFSNFSPSARPLCPAACGFFPAPRERPSRAAAALLDGLRAYV